MIFNIILRLDYFSSLQALERKFNDLKTTNPATGQRRGANDVTGTADEIAAMLRKQQRLEIASRIAAGMCAAPLDGEDWDPDNIVDVSIDMAERLIKQNEEVK